MEAAPTTEAVYQGVYALYNNPDSVEKEKASKWLESLQKSVSLTFTKSSFIAKLSLGVCNFACSRIILHCNLQTGIRNYLGTLG